jgi:hypothetical protein
VLELDTVTLHAALVGVRLVVHAAHRLEDWGAGLLALGGGQHIIREIRTLAGPGMILLDTGTLQFPGIIVCDAVLAASGNERPRGNARLALVTGTFDPSTLHGALVCVHLAIGTAKNSTPTVATTIFIDGQGSLLAGSIVGDFGT